MVSRLKLLESLLTVGCQHLLKSDKAVWIDGTCKINWVIFQKVFTFLDPYLKHGLTG